MLTIHCCECGAQCGTKYENFGTGGGFVTTRTVGQPKEYLCESCYKKKVELQGEKFKQNVGCIVACFKFVFGSIGWIFKIGWRMTKWCGRVACKIMFNKWVVSILTFGFAWAAWKILDKIYGKK